MIVKPVLTKKIDSLKVRVYETREEMGREAGRNVKEKIHELLDKKQNIRIVFAAAPSQNEVLQYLAEAKDIDWSKITVFHMDEYIGLPEEAPQRFGYYLSKKLFNSVKPKKVHLIDGNRSVKEECRRYAALLQKAPIDIVCLGIGENGHIAFNDPPVADFTDLKVVKKVEMDKECRQQQVNDGCFPSIEKVPTEALTLTIPALLSGEYLFCVVPGKSKSRAVKNVLEGPITIECPASILRTHPQCTLYVDRDAYDGK
ncbi:glucosamine-6-phosphate deaminase [Cytobacillus oceanisediminis]|uniref:Glucosamine-6-phosphate deaminase n=1 Tax=Cytobacillus oceanisediminis TaxID=665099 RepID=A0A2V3A0I3_9BACI|nr:glucosamine-6-phosphate deaminase [Cytobacillus oceanisediminis]PWW28253.1 glucosamine-6-phosphate deaminase [Cytobacillus oceanisediminis]